MREQTYPRALKGSHFDYHENDIASLFEGAGQEMKGSGRNAFWMREAALIFRIPG